MYKRQVVCLRNARRRKDASLPAMDPLDGSMAEKLRQHQLRYASPVNSEGWIFANPATGKPYWPGRIQENWLVPAAEKVGIGRIGWHTFRHSHSSLRHALVGAVGIGRRVLLKLGKLLTFRSGKMATPREVAEARYTPGTQ